MRPIFKKTVIEREVLVRRPIFDTWQDQNQIHHISFDLDDVK